MQNKSIAILGGGLLVTALGYYFFQQQTAANESSPSQQVEKEVAFDDKTVNTEFEDAKKKKIGDRVAFVNKYSKLVGKSETVDAKTTAMIELLFNEYQKQTVNREAMATAFLELDLLFSLSRYLKYQMERNPVGYNETVPAACQLMNEVVFVIDQSRLKNKRIERGLFAVLNLVPWMFQLAAEDVMFRQTCCNVLSYLALNRSYLSTEIWDKLADSCVQSNAVETLVSTQLRLADKADPSSQTAVRSCIVTLSQLALNRPTVHQRIRQVVFQLNRPLQEKLFAKWSTQSKNTHPAIEVLVRYLLEIFEDKLPDNLK